MRRALAAALLTLLSLQACKKPEAPAAAKVHSSSGVIKELKANGKVLVIDHKEFPGVMEAMTMGFELKDPKMAEGLKAGDTVEFSIEEGAEAWPIVAIKKIK